MGFGLSATCKPQIKLSQRTRVRVTNDRAHAEYQSSPARNKTPGPRSDLTHTTAFKPAARAEPFTCHIHSFRPHTARVLKWGCTRLLSFSHARASAKVHAQVVTGFNQLSLQFQTHSPVAPDFGTPTLHLHATATARFASHRLPVSLIIFPHRGAVSGRKQTTSTNRCTLLLSKGDFFSFAIVLLHTIMHQHPCLQAHARTHASTHVADTNFKSKSLPFASRQLSRTQIDHEQSFRLRSAFHAPNAKMHACRSLHTHTHKKHADTLPESHIQYIRSG